MTFLEKDLEQIIHETNNEDLISRGLFIHGKKFRQLRIGNYGIADIVTFNKLHRSDEYDLKVSVFELKKEKAGISAFLQAVRYCKGIKEYINKRKPFMNVKFEIIIVAKNIDNISDYIFLSDLVNCDYDADNSCFNLYNYSCNFDFDGITFLEETGYSLTNKGF